MIDLDHFKHYNDTLGHPMGDQCLQRVGHLLLAACRRPSDLAVRFGGDEFTLVLGNTGLAAAMELAQAVRRGVSLLLLKYKGARQVSASLGVASVVPAAELSQARLIQAADLALYQAKRAGRDVCVSCVP
jgi:diguanylate cyclase (GGDEF)-like protein